MFGYVTAYKPELKIKEYEVYKGVYCTLCKELGKEYGFLSRFILSYDGAFYVMYKSGLAKDNISISKSQCSFNPCKKCMKITCESDIYKVSAAVTVILAYFKLKDNIRDSRGVKKILSYFLYPYFAHINKKAKKKYPDIFNSVEKGMAQQFELEKDNASPDKAAHPTAQILSELFYYGECGEQAELSKQFGYQLGRTVYFLDAFDDYEKDKENSTFNPFLNSSDFIKEAKISVNLSAGALAEIYKKQQFNNFSPIIENVIYDGINYQLERISNKYGGGDNE